MTDQPTGNEAGPTQHLPAKPEAKADLDLTSAPFTYRTLRAIASTEFVPKELRGKPEAILACVLAGREWGLGPMESLSRIDMIDGRPAPSGELLVARVFAAGHEIYPEELSDKTATAVGIRHLRDGTTRTLKYTFTWEMASRVMVAKWSGPQGNRTKSYSPLTEKDNWLNYPQAMLYWRAASQLVRFLFPDVLTSFQAYTPDELGSSDWVPPPPGEEASTEPEVELAGEADGGSLDTAKTAEILEGEVVPVQEPPTPPAPQDEPPADVTEMIPATDEAFFFEELVGYVTKWLHGDEPAARLEVKRVQGRKKMTRDLARTLYAQLRTRLLPADEQGEQPTLEG